MCECVIIYDNIWSCASCVVSPCHDTTRPSRFEGRLERMSLTLVAFSFRSQLSYTCTTILRRLEISSSTWGSMIINFSSILLSLLNLIICYCPATWGSMIINFNFILLSLLNLIIYYCPATWGSMVINFSSILLSLLNLVLYYCVKRQ